MGYKEFFPLGVKWPEYEDDHSPPYNAELKKTWSYTATPHTPSRRGTYFITGTTLPLGLKSDTSTQSISLTLRS